jgi:hypothetical protein
MFMNDPRVSALVQIWFGAFGSQPKKVKDLLRESPAPLLELLLRFGHEPENRERVMEYGLSLAKADLADAVRSQDFARIQDADARLTMVAAAIDRSRWSEGEWHRYFGNKGKLWLR